MKRSRPEKLRLSKETLRSIGTPELGAVAGGARDSGPEGYFCGTVPSDCGWTYCGPCGVAQAPAAPAVVAIVVPLKRL
jgi:hypothetical protein